MNGYVNNNGVLIPHDSYAIKAGNRAHLYGDGLFESIRIVNGRTINLDNHVKRLFEGMKALSMNIPANFSVFALERIEMEERIGKRIGTSIVQL